MKAVIVMGNPKYILSNPLAIKFYQEIKDFLVDIGIKDVTFDPGEEHTTPPEADLWIGHSRGMDRLRFAPDETKTVGLGGRDGIYHPKDNQIDFDPNNPSEPNDFHFTFTEEMKKEIKREMGDK